MKFYRVVTERRRDFGEARIVKSRLGCARISARSRRSCNATAIEVWQDPSRLDSDEIYLDFDEIKDGVAAQFHPLLYGTLIISHRDFGYALKPL